ncbi:hypothetical protein B566_EDAN005982 [Ephemera danica]|nr:hypothetical protein B566_EDAN005982 [Ephemera danica]
MSGCANARHVLHSGYFHPLLRQWQSPNTSIEPENLMLPIFIVDNDDDIQDIPSMPGVKRYGINALHSALDPIVRSGLKSVLLFGVPQHLPKDNEATHADSSENPIMRALPRLRTWFPNLIIACDIGAIKAGLEATGLSNRVAVLSYAAKFASALYGPFRDAAQSAPGKGDRKAYQLPPGSSGLAARATWRDIQEGCDMLMVKPGLAYLDIARQTKDRHPEYPLFIYQVSGEYAMLLHAANNGVFQLRPALEEILLSMRRADCPMKRN